MLAFFGAVLADAIVVPVNTRFTEEELPRAARAYSVTLREAIKPLSEPQRAAVLAAR